jgi:hypothetical protein
VTVLSMPGASVTHTVPMGQVTALSTGDESDAPYAFDDEKGELVRLDTAERQVLFRYEGASCSQVHLSERLDRVALVTASGAIELYVLSSGEPLATLRVRPNESGRALVRD